jgi:CubicO group peptidase (beta-lactamase class C family)
MTDIQETVATIADELVESGAERGLQVAAYVDQRPVVDVAAGVADPGTGRPVRPGTLFYNWSIGKGATATLVHRLVDARRLGYDTPVAEVWPGFARHGKGAITVRQVLDHSAGVPGLPPDVTIGSVCSWPAMVAALEDAEPWWEPGTKVGYHAYTFGFLCGEIVRRVTGRELGDELAELTAAVGFPGEIRYGIAPDETVDLAVLEDAPSDGDWTADLPDDLPMLRAVPRTLFPTGAFGNDPRVVEADIPAGAKVTARALARLYAGWLGPVDGAEIVSAQRRAEATAESSSGPDQVFGNDSRWALGFALGLPWDEPGSDRSGHDASTPRSARGGRPAPDQVSRVFGMAGAGGSWAGADPDRGVAVAVTRNVMGMDFATVERVVRAVLDAVDRQRP